MRKKRTILWGFTSLAEHGNFHVWKLQCFKTPAVCFFYNPVTRGSVFPLEKQTSSEVGYADHRAISCLRVQTSCILRVSRHLLIIPGRGDSFCLKTNHLSSYTLLFQRTPPLWWNQLTLGPQILIVTQTSFPCVVWHAWATCFCLCYYVGNCVVPGRVIYYYRTVFPHMQEMLSAGAELGCGWNGK